jgi:hypothetical protein
MEGLKIIFIFMMMLLWTSNALLAHDVRLLTQVLRINRQQETGWQSEILARANVNRRFDLGAHANYLERFNQHDRAAGPYAAWRPKDWLALEGGYLKGGDNEILPREQYYLNAYYALEPGYSPFLLFRQARFSVTQLQATTLGIEIERMKRLIFIPQVMLGKVTFTSPGHSEEIYNYGLRAIYYVEKFWSVFLYGHMGREASQGIIGRSSILVDTMTGGLGGSYHLTPHLRAEVAFDYTDFNQLNNQFLTSTFNLTWSF